MKRYLSGLIFMMSCAGSHAAADVVGKGYIDSVDCVLLAGKHRNGSEGWNKQNDEWVESDSDEPYPDHLKDIDGDGYRDGVDAAKEGW